jgi:UDP-glucuronate 4-epimerase
MKILITGSAGFIGFHTAIKFIEEGHEVIGIDNINDYYSPQLKIKRLNESGIETNMIKWYHFVVSSKYLNYRFMRMNLEDKQQLFKLFQEENFDIVINLAAQAGVRYSIENPDVYIQSNITGFHYILEACRNYPVKNLVHASSSSVYGKNTNFPFSEVDKVDTPVSLYAATKTANELMAYAYSELYKSTITCLRFFTVYGPWGRPDMAPMLFAKAVLNNNTIDVFNNGNMYRDFTFVSDIVNGIYLASINIKQNYNILNIGYGSSINLLEFIKEIELSLDKKAVMNFMPMQAGDIHSTWANVDKLNIDYGYKPKINIQQGVKEFIKWVKQHPEFV